MAAAMALLLFHHHHHHHHLRLLLLLLLPPVYSGPELTPTSEANALLLLKDSFTNATALSSWTPGTSLDPCDTKSPWTGVVCLHGMITSLRLADMGLSGSINVDALSHFTGLRTVNFANNSFSGPIPALGRFHALKSIYLSHNQFSGPIDSHFFDGMTRVKKLWLNGNAFTGLIPYSLSKSTALLELHLEDNHFSGAIPALVLPSLSSFNVSNNDLEGAIPDIYSKFDASSFLGNKDLCGEQFGSKPCKMGTQIRSGKMVAVFFMGIIFMCLAIYLITRRERNVERGLDTLKNGGEVETEDISPASPPKEYQRALSTRKGESTINWHRRTESSSKPGVNGGEGGGGGGGAGDLVMVNEEKGLFGLPDLMKAAAEVMGSGGLGSAYKAVMTNGAVVVVKRMRDMNRVGKESFDAEMQRLGSFTHPNVLPPLAYHYRKDEKLLVYEYIPKGSLLYVLHGEIF